MSKIPKSFVMVLRRRYRVYPIRQSSNWYAAYCENGKRERVSLGVHTRPEAEVAVRTFDSAPVEALEEKPVLWADLQVAFLNHKRSTGKADKTITHYTAALDAFSRFLEKKCIMAADQISLADLEGYIAFRTGDEECDPKTAYTDALVIKGAFKWAAKASRKMLKVNPALDWETPEPVKPKRKAYTPEEVTKLESGVRPWLRPIVTTLAWTGMRIDELINLRWKEDIDFAQRVIHIRIQEGWKPKGRRDRTVPMHPKVEMALKQQHVGQHVFTAVRGGELGESYVLKVLKRDQKKLKLPDGDLHGFRRFFATSMMRAGVDAETVRQWGGWKSLETMLRYLADVEVKDSVRAMDLAVKRLVAS